MKVPIYCFITAWIFLIQGIILYLYIPSTLTLVHVILGVTSVLHHSRREKWYYYDKIKILDHVAMYAYIYLLSKYFGYDIALFALLTVILGNFVLYLINTTKYYRLMSIINCGLHVYLIVVTPKLYQLI